MKLTREIVSEMQKYKSAAIVYLLGAKGEKEPYSVAIALDSDGGCAHGVPSIHSKDITEAMLLLARDGHTSFALAWAPSQYGAKTFGLTRSERIDFARYFQMKAQGLSGVFIQPEGPFVLVARGKGRWVYYSYTPVPVVE